MKPLQTISRIVTGTATLLLLGGCIVGETLNEVAHVGSGYFDRKTKQASLERVARDWCLTIRASQVIPVYPMDEDVEVGDIYIVDTPIEKLKEYWEKKGYLPIDHRFDRLPQQYGSYYHDNGYGGVTNGSHVPRNWQFPPGKDEEEYELTNKEKDFRELTDWPRAPRAAFPSYGFRIKRGEGLNAALPVQSIPVSLGALNAREVTGSVGLSDAYTYGIDEITLRQKLKVWSQKPNIIRKLRAYAPKRESQDPNCEGSYMKPTSFIRVITRVYLVRGVNVQLTNSEASAWRVSAGAQQENADKNITFNGSGDENRLIEALQGQLGGRGALETGNISRTEAPVPIPPPPPPAPAPAPAPGDPPVAGDGAVGDDQVLPELEGAVIRERAILHDEQVADIARREQALRQQKMKDQLNSESFRLALSRTLQKDKFGGFVMPGGSLQVTSATSRSISMQETFTRPLVVGYHALDFAIDAEGKVIPVPYSTFNRMEGRSAPPFNVINPPKTELEALRVKQEEEQRKREAKGLPPLGEERDSGSRRKVRGGGGS